MVLTLNALFTLVYHFQQTFVSPMFAQIIIGTNSATADKICRIFIRNPLNYEELLK